MSGSQCMILCDIKKIMVDAPESNEFRKFPIWGIYAEVKIIIKFDILNWLKVLSLKQNLKSGLSGPALNTFD